jgi:hypothetical protein
MQSKILGNHYEIERGMINGAFNPFTGYQINNKFSNLPYQYPSDSNIFSMGSESGPFDNGMQFHDNTNGFGLKFSGGSGGTGYGHSAAGVQTHSHYGPPVMLAGGKGGKLKGAALSALTLLAFLFFLNLLQSCMKDQMDAMNPTVCLKPSIVNLNFLISTISLFFR